MKWTRWRHIAPWAGELRVGRVCFGIYRRPNNKVHFTILSGEEPPRTFVAGFGALLIFVRRWK